MSYSPSAGTLLLPLAAPPAVVVGYPGFQVPAFAVAGVYPGGQVATFAIAGAYPGGQVVTPAVAGAYPNCQVVTFAVAAGYLNSQVVTFSIAGAYPDCQVVTFSIAGDCISDPYAIFQKFRPLVTVRKFPFVLLCVLFWLSCVEFSLNSGYYSRQIRLA